MKKSTKDTELEKLQSTRQFIRLLPLQGALLTATIPRALPWARSFCPFRACCQKLASALSGRVGELLAKVL